MKHKQQTQLTEREKKRSSVYTHCSAYFDVKLSRCYTNLVHDYSSYQVSMLVREKAIKNSYTVQSPSKRTCSTCFGFHYFEKQKKNDKVVS